jgi:heme/copper-type cytochrome/quinol oxidase subunit 1
MPLLKKLLFALAAAVAANCLIWCLQAVLNYWVMGVAPVGGLWVRLFSGFWMTLFGVSFLITVFVFGMRRLGRDARRFGFEGYSPAFLFAVGFFCMFIRSFLVGKSTIDIQVHDTYFVFAGGHVEKGVAFLSGLFAVVYFYYPRVLHRHLSQGLAYLHFWLSVLGIFLFFNAAVILMDAFAVELTSRRIPGPTVWIEWHRVADVALLLLLPGQVVFLVNLVYSWGRKSI